MIALNLWEWRTLSAEMLISGLSSNLFINSVTHKAVIEVNEEGSEAAAATVLRCFAVQKEPITFIADRPFIFLITEILQEQYCLWEKY